MKNPGITWFVASITWLCVLDGRAADSPQWPPALPEPGAFRASPASGEPEDLLQDAPAGEEVIPALDPRSMRSRQVAVNRAGRLAAGRRLRLTLFSGTAFDVVITRSWQLAGVLLSEAQIEGAPDYPVLLASKDGCLSGFIHAPGGRSFSISPCSGGRHEVAETDPTIPLCAGAGTYEDARDEGQAVGQDSVWNEPLLPSGMSAVDPEAGASLCMSGPNSVMDVMVLYTTAAKDRYGGTRGVLTKIALAVGCMNSALARSGVGAEVRLIHTAETTNNGAGLSWLASDPVLRLFATNWGPTWSLCCALTAGLPIATPRTLARSPAIRTRSLTSWGTILDVPTIARSPPFVARTVTPLVTVSFPLAPRLGMARSCRM